MLYARSRSKIIKLERLNDDENNLGVAKYHTLCGRRPVILVWRELPKTMEKEPHAKTKESHRPYKEPPCTNNGQYVPVIIIKNIGVDA